jgi:hypothetical protein
LVSKAKEPAYLRYALETLKKKVIPNTSMTTAQLLSNLEQLHEAVKTRNLLHGLTPHQMILTLAKEFEEFDSTHPMFWIENHLCSQRTSTDYARRGPQTKASLGNGVYGPIVDVRALMFVVFNNFREVIHSFGKKKTCSFYLT